MSNNSIDRFAKYDIDESITVIGNVSNAIDYNFPLDYKTWLSYFTDTSVSSETYNESYKRYINSWNKVKNTFLQSQNNLVKENYVNILKELSLDVFTEHERRFIQAVNYEDPDQVDAIIPLVSNKLRNLTSYYSSFREKIKTQPRRNNIYSSSSGVKLFLINLFRDLLIYNSNTITLVNKNLVDKNFVLSNTNFVLDELYDDYQNYFDLDNTVPLSSYEYGGEVRKDQWTSNTNDFDPDVFIDYDRSATKILSSYEYVIENFVSNLSLPVALNANDVSFYKNKDFINQYNTGDINDLNLTNKVKLFSKFIGTDWYYLSTGSTNTDTFSGMLVKSENESSNFFNRNNVSTGSVANSATLVREAEIGGYYTPQYLGTLIYNSFDYSYSVNYDKLSDNNIYYYPDPNKYIHSYGNSIYKRSADLFNIYENTYVVTYDISNSAAFGYINDDSYYLNFHGYENTEEKNNIDDAGVSRSYDSVDFFKGKKSDIFSNNDVYDTVNRALYPIDLRQSKLLVSDKNLTFNTSDVYGNSYGLLKRTSSLPFTTERDSYKGITTKYLFISNGTFFYNDISAFDYAVAADGGYGNEFKNIIPGQVFTFSLSTIGVATFDAIILSSLNFGVFTMPWSFVSGYTYVKGNTYDGVFYTTNKGTLLPDTPGSDSPAWSANDDNLYYNLLLDGGSDINGVRPNFIRTAVFTKELSTSIDGGRFVYDANYYNSSKKVKKYKVPYYDSTIPRLSTSYVTVPDSVNKSIYNKKYVTNSDSFFRNSSNVVTALSAALSSIYLKYSGYPEVYNELNNDVIKLDAVYDVAVIETPNYLVIEKINYDYADNTISVYDSNLRFISRTTQGDNNLEKFGNFFYHEPSNTLLFHKTTLNSALSSTNYKMLHPTIYKLELDNLLLKQIYPKKTNNIVGEVGKYSLKTIQNPLKSNPASDVSCYNIVEIDRPVISYDVESNVYGYMYKAKDLSDCMSFYYQNFKFEDGIFTNIKNDLYFQNAKIRDENYSNPVRGSYLEYNKLDGTKNSLWIKNEGVLKLGEQQ